MTATVTLERTERLVSLTLARPPLNILDLDTIRQLGIELERLADDRDLQLLVLTGAGERAFSAGVAVEDHTPGRVPEMLALFHAAVKALRDLPALTLAVVDGHCLGGGLELAVACDLVLASEESRFGVPEIKLGCFPPVAAALFPSLLGRQRALELMLTGRLFPAAEAEALGLVTWRVPRSELTRRRAAVTAELLGTSAPVARLLKRAVRIAERQPFDVALDAAEHLYLSELTAVEDMAEGLTSFLEKRPPTWRHR